MKLKPYKRKWYKRTRASRCLYEVGSAVLLFGLLSQHVELQHTSLNALNELATLGYQIPNDAEPVRVFPSLTEGSFSASHAGGWRPGSIFLRSQPEGELGAEVYLRHELFHEASFRTCHGVLPNWAEEMAAMHFSGELKHTEATWPSDAEINAFKHRQQQSAQLTQADIALLKRIAVNTAWPTQPCAVPPALKKLLTNTELTSGYVLINLASARIVARGGDWRSVTPPGSLLKLPYAAALASANSSELGHELAASDTDKLLLRYGQFSDTLYQTLLSPIVHQQLPKQSINTTTDNPSAWLGERLSSGEFPIQASLPELALSLRAALLLKPDYFQGLSQNGSIPNSTLAGQAEDLLQVIRQQHVIVKTGSVSTATGQPLFGLMALAWPASKPVYLTIFRQAGVRGASLLAEAVSQLKQWQHQYPVSQANVRVHVLSLLPRESWQVDGSCPELTTQTSRFNLCGQYRVDANAQGSRSIRYFQGIFDNLPNRQLVLTTDVFSYTEGVLSAEAQPLTGSARAAMRAVIAWNGRQGQHRHSEANALCDTTHCMVFMGALQPSHTAIEPLDNHLLDVLTELAHRTNTNWLSFAKGGEQRWQTYWPQAQLTQLLAEPWIQDIRRERRKTGDIWIHLYYAEQEETLSCEVFRNRLKLASCPDTITLAPDQASWVFSGIGQGHGLGLSLSRAQALSEQGMSAEQILVDAYQGK